MKSMNKKMATAATWMVFARLSDKLLGLFSTLILARLLVPADFGLVAMAMSVVVLGEILTAFSFDTALVSNHKPPVSHYHTAWTLNVLFMSIAATVIALLAFPAAHYYGDDRLIPIILVVGASLAIQGFENIGIVAFRKEMTFGREFTFIMGKRLTGLAVTLPLAFATRSYWALVAGIVALRLAGVILSYLMHRFRPHWSLTDWRELIAFSKWLLLNSLISFLNTRSADFIIGRLAGPTGLGVYSLGYEISTLPSSDLVAPINRAVLPGYASYGGSKTELRAGYLDVLGAIALMALPAAFGIAAIAEPLVHVLLGNNWLAAIPVIEIVALYGAWTAVDSNSYSVYLAIGKPKIATYLAAMRASMLLPSLYFMTRSSGIEGAAMALLAVGTIATPVTFVVIIRLLHIPIRSFFAPLWRPLTSAVAMYAVIHSLNFNSVADDAWGFELVAKIGTGIIAYTACLGTLWLLSGRPKGVEQAILARLQSSTNS